MSADIIALPVARTRDPASLGPQRLARAMHLRGLAQRERLSAREFVDLAAVLSRLADDDRRIVAHLLADDLGFDLVPARDKSPKDAR